MTKARRRATAAPAAAAPMPMPAAALEERPCELLLVWLKEEETVDGITLVDGVAPIDKLVWLSEDDPEGLASCEFDSGLRSPFGAVWVEMSMLKVLD